MLAWEAGRKYGMRVNTISAGPLASRAAIAIKKGAPGERNYIDYCIDYNMANSVCVFFVHSLVINFFSSFFCFSSAEQLLGDRREIDLCAYSLQFFNFSFFFCDGFGQSCARFLSPSAEEKERERAGSRVVFFATREAVVFFCRGKPSRFFFFVQLVCLQQAVVRGSIVVRLLSIAVCLQHATYSKLKAMHLLLR